MMGRYTLAVPFTAIAEPERRRVSRSTSASSDLDLFNRFIAGEDEAFVMLFRQHNQRLHTYCLKILGDAEAAEDVTQEMWEKVIGLREKPQEVRSPIGLFFRMARNLCLDHLRKSRRLVPLDDPEEQMRAGEERTDLTELEEMAVAALDKLSMDYREVLVLNLYCGYRFDEIAAMMGKSPDAVWAQASRARAQLRKIVAKELGSMENEKAGTKNPRGNQRMGGE